ncbi:MAG: hypothetical protein PWR04_273, partial [Anaerophaga sp.]|nr:hypothetical protein [Anaerophaga sp.]
MSYTKALGNLQINTSLGGNIMNQKDHYSALSANQLVIPGVYNFSNTDVPLASDMRRYEKEIRSLYGLAILSYKERFFLELTGRNDWSSTLPGSNNSYFYPSVTTSMVLSDMFELPAFISFAKLRAGYAQVGNDTDPYNLSDTYIFDTPWGDNLIASESSSIANIELKPEKASSYEIGTDLFFFNNRLGIDFTYYENVNKNQIIATNLPISTGYSKKWINAGQIGWTATANYSTNKTIVDELAEGIDSYTIADNRVTIIAKEGEEMGAIFGTGLQKHTDGR